MLLTCTIDGVFVDLEVAGALGVMESIRKGTSNAKVVIFACVVHAREYTDALGAGANFLLRKPLNEDGMAVRTARALKHNALIDFDFDLPARASVTGRGQVAWTNTEGMAGVILQNFRGTGRENLEAWLRIQEQLGTARKGS